MAKLSLRNSTPKRCSETNNRGQILVVILIVSTVLFIISVALVGITSAEYLSANSAYRKTEAVNLAEAGVENTIKELNANLNYHGTEGTPIALGAGEFEVTVTGSGSARQIESTAYIPSKAAYKSKKTVKLNLTVTSDYISFHYAVQIGNDGIIMNSNSTINGNTYSNGNITGTSNSRIVGDAYASGTISSPRPAVSGTKHPGSPPSEMPVLDYDFWKNQANINNNPYVGDYIINGNGSNTLGPKKIQGNLTLNSNSTLTITGPIWITGNFTMNSNAKLYIDNSFGSSGTIVIADGLITINSNSFIYSTSANPKGYILLASTNTSDSAISLNSNAANSICYALEGGITFNSNAHAKEVVGRRFILNSNATLDYDAGLVDASFSTGPGGGWTIKKGTWTEY